MTQTKKIKIKIKKLYDTAASMEYIDIKDKHAKTYLILKV